MVFFVGPSTASTFLVRKGMICKICEIFENKFKALKPNGPTVFFLNIYLMDWFEARGKRGEGTRFTWSSAVCSFQRSAAETESSNWLKHLKLSDAGDVGTWLDDKGGEGHLLGLGELKITHWVVVVFLVAALKMLHCQDSCQKAFYHFQQNILASC